LKKNSWRSTCYIIISYTYFDRCFSSVVLAYFQMWDYKILFHLYEVVKTFVSRVSRVLYVCQLHLAFDVSFCRSAIRHLSRSRGALIQPSSPFAHAVSGVSTRREHCWELHNLYASSCSAWRLSPKYLYIPGKYLYIPAAVLRLRKTGRP